MAASTLFSTGPRRVGRAVRSNNGGNGLPGRRKGESGLCASRPSHSNPVRRSRRPSVELLYQRPVTLRRLGLLHGWVARSRREGTDEDLSTRTLVDCPSHYCCHLRGGRLRCRYAGTGVEGLVLASQGKTCFRRAIDAQEPGVCHALVRAWAGLGRDKADKASDEDSRHLPFRHRSRVDATY